MKYGRDHANATHGARAHRCQPPEYSAWVAMRQRCENPANSNYHRYGGRGIRVCERWHSYEAFASDVGHRPSLAHSIDRVNVNGHYEPGNVRWATASQQGRNRRSNLVLVAFGKSMCLAEWAQETGFPADTIKQRVRKLGWGAERALTEPLHNTDPRKKAA